MSKSDAYACAFSALSEITRLLTLAVESGQVFDVDESASTRSLPDGRRELDGGCTVSIRIAAPGHQLE